MKIENLIVIRGGGDLATGVIQKFHRSGFSVLVLDIEKPTAIRRTVSLCECIYTDIFTVEDITARLCRNIDEIKNALEENIVPVVIDPEGILISELKPLAVIDAIIAKKNTGTNNKMAPITIALGPGFCAGSDVDIVIETMRGHNLGRMIKEGYALENTGIPGEIGGKSELRVIHAPISGKIKHINKIGDIVNIGETIFYVGDIPIKAPFTGLLRGLIREDLFVKERMKIADIDPRIDVDFMTISDKARTLGGAALEAFFYKKNMVE